MASQPGDESVAGGRSLAGSLMQTDSSHSPIFTARGIAASLGGLVVEAVDRGDFTDARVGRDHGTFRI